MCHPSYSVHSPLLPSPFTLNGSKARAPPSPLLHTGLVTLYCLTDCLHRQHAGSVVQSSERRPGPLTFASLQSSEKESLDIRISVVQSLQ